MEEALPYLLLAAGIGQLGVLIASALVPIRLNWREELRSPPACGLTATPEEFVLMLCAVHSVTAPVILFLWISAASRRSSPESRGWEPRAGWSMGEAVVGTVRRMFVEIAGVPPEFVTRRMASRLWKAKLDPMTYPLVACGSSLSTPCTLAGPSLVLELFEPSRRWRKAVTVSVPERRIALFTT